MKLVYVEQNYLPSDSLSEIGQSTKSVFCLVGYDRPRDNTIMQLTNWMQCRDYLGDAMFSIMSNQPVDVHGFKFDPTTLPKFNHYGIVMSNQARNASDYRYLCPSSIDSIADGEEAWEHLDFGLPWQYVVDTARNVCVLVKLKPSWINSITVSLITSLMRCSEVVGNVDLLLEKDNCGEMPEEDNAYATIQRLRQIRDTNLKGYHPVRFILENIIDITEGTALGSYKDVTIDADRTVKVYKKETDKEYLCSMGTLHDKIGINSFLDHVLQGTAGYGFLERWRDNFIELCNEM